MYMYVHVFTLLKNLIFLTLKISGNYAIYMYMYNVILFSFLSRWKQLCMVTVFYFIFVFIFALLGVHIIGRLDRICVYNG